MPAVPKGGGTVPEALRRRATLAAALHGVLLAVLLLSAVLARDRPLTAALYAWSGVIPLGFGLIYLDAYRRGAAARTERRWSKEFEQAEAKRAYRLMGLVVVLWVAGVVAIWAAL